MKKFTLVTIYALVLALSLSTGAIAGTITSNAVTNTWATAASWVGGVVPTANDSVVIVSGANITVGASAPCAAINVLGTLTMGAGNTLTVAKAGTGYGCVAGNGTIANGTTAQARHINFNGDWSFTGTYSGNKGDVDVSGSNNQYMAGGITGTINVLTVNKAGGWLYFSTTTLPASTTFTLTAGNIGYTAAGAQALKVATYTNLVLGGSGAKTVTGITISATGTLDIQGTATTAGTSPTYTAGATLKYSGSSAQTTSTVELPATTSVNVIINNSNGVTLNASTTFNGSLTCTIGNLSTGANTVTLGATGTITESSGNTVIGNVSVTRTLALATNDTFGGVGCEINAAGGTPGATTVTRVTGTALTGSGASSITRYFDITPTTNTGLNATFVFHYFASELNGNTAGVLALNETTDGGATWTNQGGIDNAVTGTITLAGVNSFSRWTAVNATTPLPVELVSFAATQLSATSVQLNWSTVSETNVLGYYVERSSVSSGPYTVVSSLIAGSGTSLQQHNYSFTDNGVSAGTYYYKIHQVNLDGTGEYSSVLTVHVGSSVLGVREEGGVPTAFKLKQNYPNPFNPSTDIKFSIKDVGFTTLKVYNSLGQEVAALVNGMMQPGNYVSTWNANAAPSGVYFCRLESGSNLSVQRMMLVK